MQQAMVVAGSEQPDFGGSAADAPPKQVARAMDRLGRAARLIADVRLGADRLLEAVLLAEEPRQTKRSAHYILEEDASMREHLNDLRTLGRQLEESGVLSGSLKSRGNTWGLHMPLVCPDGAIVAYAWKRQLAGQAGASAVDRTRLALKAFSDQKRRYFPHLEDDDLIDQSSVAESGPPKKIRRFHTTILTANHIEQRSLSAILSDFSNEMSSVRISSYKRTDWLKRASSEALFADEDQSSMDSAVASGQASVVELLVPSVFRAVLSLHPAGSTTPDAIAVFSTDEGGSHVNSRGTSLHKIYQHISEHAEKTLQHFVNVEPDLALPRLLHWMSSYQTLFSETCRKCEKLLINDRSLNLLLPPILRPFQQSGRAPAYHACCYTNDTSS